MNKYINIFLAIIFLITICVRIYVSDSVVTAGTDLARLENNLKQLEVENEQLENEYLSLISLNNMEKRATASGYAYNTFEFLDEPGLALR